jgi:hypothetical protein
VIKLSPRKDAGISRGELLAHVNFLARKLFYEIVKEYSRLNSARIGKDELSQLGSRERVHAVKAALAEHHKGSARCC